MPARPRAQTNAPSNTLEVDILEHDFSTLAPRDRYAALVESVRNDVAALLLIHDPDVLDEQVPLHRYGFDDVGGEMLRTCIAELTGVELPDELPLQNASIAAIAAYSLEKWVQLREPRGPSLLH